MIRPLNVHDVNIVFDIVEAHSKNPQFANWQIANVRSELQSGGGIGEFNGDKLMSFVLFKALDSHLEISLLATSSEFEGQGHMRGLLGHLSSYYPQKETWLEVHEANERARQIYEKAGFFVVGKRLSYYPDGGTAVLYSRL